MLNRIMPILLNIGLSIAVIIGLAMAAKPLTGKSWQTWLGNEELDQAQKQMQILENKIMTLDQNYANLLAMKEQSAHKSDTQSQKFLWLIMKLQQKFTTGESYRAEWQDFVSLLPSKIAQEPSIATLEKYADTGLMTQEKLKQVLLTKKHPSPPHKEPTASPSTFWEHLKTIVTIERESSHFEVQEILAAVEQDQLEDYIARHPEAAWATPYVETWKASHNAITSFYTLLDPLFLPQEKI